MNMESEKFIWKNFYESFFSEKKSPFVMIQLPWPPVNDFFLSGKSRRPFSPHAFIKIFFLSFKNFSAPSHAIPTKASCTDSAWQSNSSVLNHDATM